jgi:trehalose-6-phosphate synthase
VTALRAGQLRICGLFLRGSGDFIFFQSIQTVYELCTVSIQRVLAAYSPGIKEMGHHSHPSSAKTHNYSSQISTPALWFTAHTVYGKFTYTSSWQRYDKNTMFNLKIFFGVTQGH